MPGRLGEEAWASSHQRALKMRARRERLERRDRLKHAFAWTSLGVFTVMGYGSAVSFAWIALFADAALKPLLFPLSGLFVIAIFLLGSNLYLTLAERLAKLLVKVPDLQE